MNLKLVKPSKEYQKEICEMLDEWEKYNKENITANPSPAAIFKNDYHDFDYYLANLELKEAKNGLVPDSVFFLYDEDERKMLGAVNIRHYLNDYLFNYGGHIGDGIRPSARKKGYGTKLIKLALQECAKLGIDKVLIVCDKTNLASEKTILNNGGILASEVTKDNHTLKRYFIDLAENKLKLDDFFWIREPKINLISEEKLEIVTEAHTDLWQRTYYHFRNDNAPLLVMTSKEKYFTFTVKVDFSASKHRFDQAGIVLYLDSNNWLKASVEYEDLNFSHLGSVVTNNGYSDWATTEIKDVKTIWYRLSRRADDFLIENSLDGFKFSQMRVAHLAKATDKVKFGIYACSPEDSSFKAIFTNLSLTNCKWKAHVGQAPDKDL